MVGTIPPEIGNLTSLTRLVIQNSGIVGPLPATLGNLSNLEELSLIECPVTGTIPASLGQLGAIKIIVLRSLIESRSSLELDSRLLVASVNAPMV